MLILRATPSAQSAAVAVFGAALLAQGTELEAGTFMDRVHADDLRVMTWNINWDSIFPDGDPNNHPFRTVERVAEFRRVIGAINPDIACIQEINPARNAQDVAAIFNIALPLGGGAVWFAARGNDDCTVSRWPFTRTDFQTVPGGFSARCMTWINLPATFPRDFYVINEHFKCCGGATNEAARQRQADSLVNWLRDCRTPGGSITLPTGTPFIIAGDLNTVEGPQVIQTLLCGDILDNATYGADSPTDWDGSCMTDAHPLHNIAGPDDYTWREDSSQFDPGRLDYVLYADSQLRVVRRYVLNTTAMVPADLAEEGLQPYDTVLSPPGDFDHLPVVVDFRFGLLGDMNCDGAVDVLDINPFTLALSDPLAYASAFPGCSIANGDANNDGATNVLDINPFVTLLAGG